MKKHLLKNFKKGWFIGDFEPTLKKTKDFEIAIKLYKKGNKEEKHYHKIATEYTAFASGVFKMNGKFFRAGDIVEIAKKEAADFECLKPGITLVIKIPSAKNDKHLINK